MIISAIKNENEQKIALTPASAKKFIDAGHKVVLPSGYGVEVGFGQDEYLSVGATFGVGDFISDSDVYLCVSADFHNLCLKKLKSGSAFVGLLRPFDMHPMLKKLIECGVHAFALELIPRITRAQSMDVMSSQANLAGYRAALEVMARYNRVVPLMMTAAGTLRPAKVLVVGAGVAGLQAIATCKRLGATVSAFDVRHEVKDQVVSLGATFVEVDCKEEGDGTGGYAKEMSDTYRARQSERLKDEVAVSDIVITTAQIPGKRAPELITNEMVSIMRNGSIIVDMAVQSGGNCSLSKAGEIVNVNGVQILGFTDYAGMVGYDASQFYARNVFEFVSHIIKNDSICCDMNDEIIAATLLTV